MAIKTVAPQRTRTELQTFVDAVLATAVAAFQTEEGVKAADTDKTWSSRIINVFNDGANYVVVAEFSYPEISDDPVGQVPELP